MIHTATRSCIDPNVAGGWRTDLSQRPIHIEAAKFQDIAEARLPIQLKKKLGVLKSGIVHQNRPSLVPQECIID